MKEFLESLSPEQKNFLGHVFVDALTSEKLVSGATMVDVTPEEALQEAIEKLLEAEISFSDYTMSDGIANYIYETARQVMAGQYHSLAEIQAEVDGLIEEETKARTDAQADDGEE